MPSPNTTKSLISFSRFEPALTKLELFKLEGGCSKASGEWPLSVYYSWVMDLNSSDFSDFFREEAKEALDLSTKRSVGRKLPLSLRSSFAF
jgi:hypothetical protein